MNPPPLSAAQRREAGLRLLREAADLGQHCEDLWRDLRESTEGGVEVAYAVDVDVIVMFTAPEKSFHYGRVFSEGAPPTDVAAASVMGEYIIQRWPGLLSSPSAGPEAGRGSLTIIPPHDAELRRVGLSVAAQALEERGHRATKLKLEGAVRERLQRVLRGVEPQRRAEVLYEELLREGWLVHPKEAAGARQQLQRLEELPPGRFVGLRRHPWFSGPAAGLLPPRTGELWQRPGPAAEPPDPTLDSFRASVDRWHERLMAHWPGHLWDLKRRSILDDALVLARLEWVNRGLAADTARPRRMVLVTGTERLFEAGAAQPALHEGFAHFSAAYLRHPRAFFGAKEVLSDLAGDAAQAQAFDLERVQFRVADWLSVMFPNDLAQERFDGGRIGMEGSSVRIAFSQPAEATMVGALERLLSGEHDLFRDEPFPLGALHEWDRTVQSANERSQYRREQQRKTALARDLSDLLSRHGDADDGIDLILAHLRQRELASLVKLYALTDVIGVVQLLAPEQKMKGLPALRFDPGFETAQQQCDELCRLLFRPAGQGRPESFDPGAMFDALHETDPSDYHARVLLAYVFACVGKWFQVRTLCYIALLTVDAIPGKAQADRRTGREAAYLLAVAERRLAINPAGIENARQALAEAIRRNGGQSEIRFESEALAQRVAQAQLLFYAGRGEPPPRDPMHDIGTALELVVHATAREVGVIRRWVVRQGVTTGLLAALMSHEARTKTPQVTGSARRLLQVLEDEGQAPPLDPSATPPAGHPVYLDGVSDFVWLVGTVVFGQHPDLQERARALLAEEYRHLAEDPSPTPLERARHTRLLGVAGLEPA